MPRQLLIVEPDARARDTLESRLVAAGYGVTPAPSLDAARADLKRHMPEVVLMNARAVAGAETLVRLIGARAGNGRTPVILLDDGAKSRHPGGAVDAVIRWPAPEALLLARLRSVLRLRDLEEEMMLRASTCRDLGMADPAKGFARPPQVLLVPQKLADGVALADALSFEFEARISVLPRDRLLAKLDQRGSADIVVIEADPRDPAADLSCLADLHCRRETRNAAILMRFPEGAEATAAMALDLGAADVTVGASGPAMLCAMMRCHLDRAERLRALRTQVADGLRLAVIDPLTGLYNRRYAMSHTDRLAARAAELGRPLALMVLDIDRFKRVNDTHGHQNGDRVIFAVARALADGLRAADLVARIGGEEFLVVMPDTGAPEARRAAQRLCERVAAMPVRLDDGGRVQVTLSIGLMAGVPPTEAEAGRAEQLIAAADRALLDAKSAGRNMVTVSRSAA